MIKEIERDKGREKKEWVRYKEKRERERLKEYREKLFMFFVYCCIIVINK